MTEPDVRCALLSVSDKRGLEPLARALAAAGYVLLSTGGTARALRGAGLDVVDVADHTAGRNAYLVEVHRGSTYRATTEIVERGSRHPVDVQVHVESGDATSPLR